MPNQTPLRLTAMTFSQSPSSVSTIVAWSSTPALLCAKSRRPKASTVRATTASQSAATVTSPATKTAWPPSCSMRCTVSSASSWRTGRSVTSTPAAPSRARASAVARPMPPAKPVTSPALPSTRPGICPPSRCSGRDRPRVLDVAAHLLHQRLDRFEALLPPQALEELHPQRRAVEVAVEVHEEGLDELAAAGDEHRAHADVRGGDVHGAVGGPRAAGVDAVAGDDVAIDGDEVGRREAQRAPALVAVGDLAGDREGSAQQLVGVLDRAAEHQPADVAGRHHLAVDLEQVHDACLEAAIAAQQLLAAGRLVAEAEVLPHADVLGVQRADEDVVDEALRAAPGELAVEGDDDQLLHPELLNELDLALERGQQARRASRGHHRRGMRLEGDHGVGVADDLAVAEMDPVEGAHRDAARARLDVGEMGDLHPRNPTTGFSRPSSRGSAMATGPSASATRTCSTSASASPAGGWVGGTGIVCPWPARHAASASTSTRGRKASACSSGSTRSGSASCTSKGPIRVRRSSSQ